MLKMVMDHQMDQINLLDWPVLIAIVAVVLGLVLFYE
jgi:hypothetical protein